MHRVRSRELLALVPCLQVLAHMLCFHVDLEKGFNMTEDGSWRQLRQENKRGHENSFAYSLKKTTKLEVSRRGRREMEEGGGGEEEQSWLLRKQ